jgi:hypothetical protein
MNIIVEYQILLDLNSIVTCTDVNSRKVTTAKLGKDYQSSINDLESSRKSVSSIICFVHY